MKKELELQLVEKYPKILKEYGGSPQKTCMAYGFEHRDGWYDILDRLMAKLQYLSDCTGCQVVAAQIKEKFGTLCFYFDIENESGLVRSICYDVVGKAEDESARTCEETGGHGALCVRGSWYKTLGQHAATKDGFTPVNKDVAEKWKILGAVGTH